VKKFGQKFQFLSTNLQEKHFFHGPNTTMIGKGLTVLVCSKMKKESGKGNYRRKIYRYKKCIFQKTFAKRVWHYLQSTASTAPPPLC
jgi:hypothetical protein